MLIKAGNITYISSFLVPQPGTLRRGFPSRLHTIINREREAAKGKEKIAASLPPVNGVEAGCPRLLTSSQVPTLYLGTGT
jgi:hypothetical protein